MSLFDDNYRDKMIQDILNWEFPARASLGPGLGAFLGAADKRDRANRRLALLNLSEVELHKNHAAAKNHYEQGDRDRDSDAYDGLGFPNFFREVDQPQAILEQWKLASDDIAYWCNLEHWTIDEFIALSFDLCPTKATPENLRKFRHRIPGATYQNITQRTEICRRAQQARQIMPKMPPDRFALWAKTKNILLSAEISTLIKTAAPYSSAESKPISAEIADKLQAQTPGNQHKAATARADTSLYKILYAIAVSRYKFDPDKRNSSSPSMILAELERVGLSMDVATIKSHLSKAAEIVDEIKSNS